MMITETNLNCQVEPSRRVIIGSESDSDRVPAAGRFQAASVADPARVRPRPGTGARPLGGGGGGTQRLDGQPEAISVTRIERLSDSDDWRSKFKFT